MEENSGNKVDTSGIESLIKDIQQTLAQINAELASISNLLQRTLG